MPAYNFQPRFVPLIESGQKYTTIRMHRGKRPTKQGDPLYLYTGQRTKACKLIAKTTVDFVIPMQIVPTIRRCWQKTYLEYEELTEAEIEKLAMVDGFESLDDFYKWFEKTHPGLSYFQLIAWQPLNQKPVQTSANLIILDDPFNENTTPEQKQAVMNVFTNLKLVPGKGAIIQVSGPYRIDGSIHEK
jgi:hypothetical protein